MRPQLIEIGGFTIYAYGMMIFLAFTVGIAWAYQDAPRKGVNRDHVFEAATLAILLAMLGSRLAYVLAFPQYYLGQPWWKIFAFRDGGLIFYGGFLAALCGVAIYCRFKKILFFQLLDLFSPFIALGYAITRVGCFLAGCCYGVVTDLPWGVVFPALDNLSRHPTQLYASASVLLIFFALRYLSKFSFFHGFTFVLFIIFYGIYRFIIEFIRVDPPVFLSLSLAQVVSVFMVAGGVFIFLRQRYRVLKGDPSKSNM